MELSQVLQALRNADAAGDVEAARRLAQIAKEMMQAAPPASPQAAPAAPESGLLASAIKGGKQMLSSGQTALESLLGSDPEAAARAGIARGEELNKQYASEVSLDKLKKVYEQQGLLPAAGEALRQVPYAISEQAPNIGATLASARLGAMAGSPFGAPGALIGGITGAAIPSLFTQAGSNIERQAQERKPIDVGAAYSTAVPQAALDVAGTLIPLGRTLVGKALGPNVSALLERGAAESAEALAKESLLKVLAKGTAIGAAAEVPTEVTQQMLERYQAGLPLLSPDALKEYGETAYQTTLLAPIGAAGRVASRGDARRIVEEREQVKQGEELLKQRKAEAEAEAAEEARKLTPDYALDFAKQHEALQAEYDDLGAQLKQKLPPGSSFAQKQTFEDLKKRRGELKEQLSEQASEYNRLRPIFQPIRDQEAAAQKAAADAAAQQAAAEQQARMAEEQFAGPMQQQMLPGFERGELPQVETSEDTGIDYLDQAKKLRDYLETLQTKALETTDLAAKIKIGDEYTRVQKALKEAETLAKKTAPDTDKQVAALRKKMASAEELGDIDAQVKLAKQLQALGVTDLAQGTAPLDFGPLRTLPPGETQGQFNARLTAPAFEEQTQLFEQQTSTPQTDFLTQWQEDQEALDVERRESSFDTEVTGLINKALQGTPKAEVPEGVEVDRNAANTLRALDEYEARANKALKDMQAAQASGNREAVEAKSREYQDARTAITEMAAGNATAKTIVQLRKDREAALMSAAGLIDDLRTKLTLSTPGKKGAASSTAKTLRIQIDKQRAAYIDAAVKEAAALRRAFGKELTKDEAVKAAMDMQSVFDEWVSRSVAAPSSAYEFVKSYRSGPAFKNQDWVKPALQAFIQQRVSEALVAKLAQQRKASIESGKPALHPETKITADERRSIATKARQDFEDAFRELQPTPPTYTLRGSETVKSSPGRARMVDPRPASERPFAAPQAAVAALQEQLDSISRELASVPDEGRRVKGEFLQMQFPEVEAERVAEERGEKAQSLSGELRRRREYVEDQINQALQTRAKMPIQIERALKKVLDNIDTASTSLLDAAETLAGRVLSGRTERVTERSFDALKQELNDKRARFAEVTGALNTGRYEGGRKLKDVTRQNLKDEERTLKRDIQNLVFELQQLQRQEAQKPKAGRQYRADALEDTQLLREIDEALGTQQRVAQTTEPIEQKQGDLFGPQDAEAELTQAKKGTKEQLDEIDAELAKIDANAEREQIKRLDARIGKTKNEDELTQLKRERHQAQMRIKRAVELKERRNALAQRPEYERQAAVEAAQERVRGGRAEAEAQATAFERATARNFANSPPVKKARQAIEDLAEAKKRLAEAIKQQASEEKAKRSAKIEDLEERIEQQREVYRETFEAALARAKKEAITRKAMEQLEAIGRERAEALRQKDPDAARDLEVILNMERAAFAEALLNPNKAVEPSETVGLRDFTQPYELQAFADEWVEFERNRLRKLEAQLERAKGQDRPAIAKQVQEQKEATQKAVNAVTVGLSGLGLPGYRVVGGVKQAILSPEEKRAEADKAVEERARINAQDRKSVAEERQAQQESLEQQILALGDERAGKVAQIKRARSQATIDRLQAEIVEIDERARMLEEQLGTARLTRSEKQKLRKPQKTQFKSTPYASSKALLPAISEKISDALLEAKRNNLAASNPKTDSQLMEMVLNTALTPYERNLWNQREDAITARAQRTGESVEKVRGVVMREEEAAATAAKVRGKKDTAKTKAEPVEEVKTVEKVKDAETEEDTALDVTDIKDVSSNFNFGGEKTLEQLAATASQGPALKEKVDVEESAAAVANNIAKSGSTELNRAVAERLKMLLGATRMELVKDLRDEDGQPAYGQAAADGSFIRLDSKFGLNEQTFLHEGVHAAVERSLRLPEDKLTEQQRQAKRELEELFAAYKKLPNASNENAKTSLSEFVADALSDGRMQAEMRAEKWTLKNMWQSFKSAILNMLGVKTPSNMLEATLAAADALMTRVPRATAADTAILGPKVLNRPRGLNSAFNEADELSRKVVAGQRTWMQRTRANATGLNFETSLIDRFAGFERLAKYMPKLQGSQMMFYLRMYDQRMNFVAQSAANGALQLKEIKRKDGQTEYVIESGGGPSLNTVVSTLKQATPIVGNGDAVSRLFTLYLVANRAKRVGFDKLDISGKLTEAQLNAAVKQIESNAKLKQIFENARDLYNQYNEGLIRFAQKTGVFSEKQAEALLKSKDYIPWYRERNGVAELFIGGETPFKLGNIKDMPHLQSLVGGDSPIIDFMVSSVQNTNMLVDMSLNNLATRNAVLELVDIGAAKITPKPISGPDVVRFKHKGEDRYAILDTERITVGGKTVDTGVPADLLVKGMQGIPVQLTGLMRMMALPTQLLRRAVTLSPLYMVRQVVRDSTQAAMASGADIVPVLSALKEIGSATKGTLERRGITGGQVFTGTTEDITAIMRRIANGDNAALKLIGGMEALGMEADALTRRAQYNSYIRQGLSEMEATLMALESMNFNKRGASPSVHFANSMIPFFNAQIQGLNALYKAMMGQASAQEKARIKQKLIVRGSMMMAAALAYAHAMQDDEAYKNALPADKYSNWFLRLPGVDEPVRIPIPFELGYIFKALPEAMYNTIVNKHGKEEAAEAFWHILQNTIPGGSSYFIPQIFKPAIEVAANYSFFTGRAIVSSKEQMLLPEDQYRESTTELVKIFGGATGMSPIKIEALIRGYTGSMGLAVIGLASMPFVRTDTPEKATKRLSDMPVIGGMFQPNDARWVINSTYDQLKDAQQVQASFKARVEKGDRAGALALINERTNDYARAELAGYYRQQMGELNKAETAVKASDMTPEKKREMITQIQQYRIQLSKLVRNASDASKLMEP